MGAAADRPMESSDMTQQARDLMNTPFCKAIHVPAIVSIAPMRSIYLEDRVYPNSLSSPDQRAEQ